MFGSLTLVIILVTGDLFKVSMYSEFVDVSEIAVKYGGGGHKGASGFQCTELPFRKGI